MLFQSRLKKQQSADHFRTPQLHPEVKFEPARAFPYPSHSQGLTKKRYEPTETQLCEAVVLIRKIMPNRSLERAITLMHQILNKNTPLEVAFAQTHNPTTHPQQPPNNHPPNDHPLNNHSLNNHPPTNQPQLPEVTKTYEKNSLLKSSFANQQEEAKYKEKRLVAKSFVGKGYGHQFAIEEFNQAKFNSPLTKDNYKRIIGSVVTQAFRKLESFLMQDCSRPITPLSKEEMAKIITPLLSSTHFGHHIPVFKKFLRLIYGLSKVVLCERETASFHQAVLKQLQGSHNKIAGNGSQVPRHQQSVPSRDQKKLEAPLFQNGVGRKKEQLQQRQMMLGRGEQKIEYQQWQNWSEQQDASLINTYLAQPSINSTYQLLNSRNPFYSATRIRTRLFHLVSRALSKLHSDQSLQLQPPQLSQSQLHFVARARHAAKARAKLLQYLQQRYPAGEMACEVAMELHALMATEIGQKGASEQCQQSEMDEEDAYCLNQNNSEIYQESEVQVKQESDAPEK